MDMTRTNDGMCGVLLWAKRTVEISVDMGVRDMAIAGVRILRLVSENEGALKVSKGWNC
jgi:hypothetical protein